MRSINDAIANLRAVNQRRKSNNFIERTLIVLVVGVGLIMSIQHTQVTGATEHLLLNSAHANAPMPMPAFKFVEGKLVKY